jgi:hypothetical protein
MPDRNDWWAQSLNPTGLAEHLRQYAESRDDAAGAVMREAARRIETMPADNPDWVGCAKREQTGVPHPVPFADASADIRPSPHLLESTDASP